MEGVKYIHFGIKAEIQLYLQKNENIDLIKLLVGVDGASYAEKSTNYEMWPIMGFIYPNGNVFLIGCFFGKQKPINCDEILERFITDINILITKGIKYCYKVVNVYIMAIRLRYPCKSIFMQNQRPHRLLQLS